MPFSYRSLPAFVPLMLLVASAIVVAGQLPPGDALPDPRLVAHVDKLDDLAPVSPLDVAISKAFDFPGDPLHPGHMERSTLVSPSLEVAPLPAPPNYTPRPSRRELLKSVCFLDAAVVATPSAVHVIANASRTNLVTVFELRVSQWLRPAAGPRTVTVPYMGGQAMIAGETYQSNYGTRSALPRLDVTGIAYLMRDRPHDFYRISGAMVQEAGGRVTLEGLREPLASAVAEVTAATASCKDSGQ